MAALVALSTAADRSTRKGEIEGIMLKAALEDEDEFVRLAARDALEWL